MRMRNPLTRAVQCLVCGLLMAAYAHAARACAGNPVYCENQNPGSTAWQLNGSSTYDATVLGGYASSPSVALGEEISFYVRAPGPYTIRIFRLGYYQGSGGRLLDEISETEGQSQPKCRWLQSGTANEYYSCDNWSDPVSYTVNSSWVSGVYLALLTASVGGTTYQYHIPFVVRDDQRHADFLYQVDVATDEAYNAFSDGTFTPPSPSFPLSMSNTSLYAVGTLAHYRLRTDVVFKVSFDRPFGRIDGTGLYKFELPFISWLEQQGYDTVYTTDIDTHEGHENLRSYKALLVAGHSEYWSKRMYDAFLGARNAGVNLGFFSGDSIYWQARFEPNASGIPDRIMVCFRRPNPVFAQPGSTQPPAVATDPSTDPTLQTIYWRDPPLGRDEQTLVGTHKPNPYGGPPPTLGWVIQGLDSLIVNPPQPLTVENHLNWVYAGTGLADGESVSGVYGQEANAFETLPTSPPPGARFFFRDPPFQPPGAREGTFTLLGNSVFTIPGASVEPTVNTSVYQACGGAWVFSAGSIMWGNALAPSPPVGGLTATGAADPVEVEDYTNADIQQMTANVLNVFNGSAPAPESGPCPGARIMMGSAAY